MLISLIALLSDLKNVFQNKSPTLQERRLLLRALTFQIELGISFFVSNRLWSINAEI